MITHVTQIVTTKRRRRDISVAHDVSRGSGAQEIIRALGEGERNSVSLTMQREILLPSPRAGLTVAACCPQLTPLVSTQVQPAILSLPQQAASIQPSVERQRNPGCLLTHPAHASGRQPVRSSSRGNNPAEGLSPAPRAGDWVDLRTQGCAGAPHWALLCPPAPQASRGVTACVDTNG